MSTMRWVRKHVVWIAGAAVGGFLLWIVGTVVSLQTMGPGTAGLLFGRKVLISDYLGARRAVEHQARLTHGDRYGQALSEQDLADQTWERLMLLHEARRQRIRISDQEVVAFLQNSPIFQAESGAFSPDGYNAVVRYNLGTTPRLFEEEIRDTLKIRKLLQSAVQQDPIVTEEEVQAAYRLQEEALRVRYVPFPDEKLAREVAHAAAQNPGQLDRAADQLGLAVVTMDPAKRATALPDGGAAETAFGPLFSQEVGTVSGPVRRGKTWVVARLEEKIPPDEGDFPARKESLREELTQQKRIRAYLTWYQDLIKRAQPQRTVTGGN